MSKLPEQDREDRLMLERYRALADETTDPLAALLLRDIIAELERMIDNAAAAAVPTPEEKPPGNS